MARTWSFYGSRESNWQLTATWLLYFCVPFIVFWSVPPREAKVLLLCYCLVLAIMAGFAAIRQKSWLLALVSLFAIGFYIYCIGVIFIPYLDFSALTMKVMESCKMKTKWSFYGAEQPRALIWICWALFLALPVILAVPEGLWEN